MLAPGRIGFQDEPRLAPICVDAIDSRFPAAELRKEDVASGAPGRQGFERGLANDLGRTTRGVDSLELSSGKETEKPAVGRPERALGSLGPLQGLRLQRAERPQEEPSALARFPDENEPPPVRRQGRLESRSRPAGN